MKKSQIANHFFVTKATDLNVYFEKPLKNVCRDMCHIFTFFYPFSGIFFNPVSQTIKVIV